MSGVLVIYAEFELAVERLIAITRANQSARRDTLDWPRTEFGIETPGQKLEAFVEEAPSAAEGGREAIAGHRGRPAMADSAAADADCP